MLKLWAAITKRDIVTSEVTIEKGTEGKLGRTDDPEPVWVFHTGASIDGITVDPLDVEIIP